MEVVREVIEDELHLNIPIAGLAKDNKHRTSELLFGFPAQTIGIKQQSSLFRLLTQIRMKYTVLRLLSTATSAASDRSHRLWIALKGLEKRQKQPY